MLVNKSLCDDVVEMSNVSHRVAYLVMKQIEKNSLKVVQIYAPTSAHPDDEVNEIFEDNSKALHSTTKALNKIIMGDFNAIE